MINRTRYIIMRDDGAIFCGLSRDFKFKKVEDIGDISLKTYSTENKAIDSFLRSWYADKKDFRTGKYKVVKVTESITIDE